MDEILCACPCPLGDASEWLVQSSPEQSMSLLAPKRSSQRVYQSWLCYEKDNHHFQFLNSDFQTGITAGLPPPDPKFQCRCTMFFLALAIPCFNIEIGGVGAWWLKSPTEFKF